MFFVITRICICVLSILLPLLTALLAAHRIVKNIAVIIIGLLSGLVMLAFWSSVSNELHWVHYSAMPSETVIACIISGVILCTLHISLVIRKARLLRKKIEDDPSSNMLSSREIWPPPPQV
jgi:uncharacterized membrane protein